MHYHGYISPAAQAASSYSDNTFLMALLSTPVKALIAGGICYGAGVLYMTTKYYDNSLMKRIFVRSDKIYDHVKICHHAGVAPPTE